jgi:hypothetical protein
MAAGHKVKFIEILLENYSFNYYIISIIYIFYALHILCTLYIIWREISEEK